MKNVWRFLKKLKIELPYDLAVPLLGICPEKRKSLIRKGTCIPVFMAALWITAKTRKHPRCPTDKGMDKEDVVHIHNGILLSHKKE